MTFEEALKALKEGKKIRKKWWYAGSYIWLDEKNTLKNKNGSETSVAVEFDFMTNNKWEIYEEPVLDEKEKEYLSAVIKPFRNMVVCICKLELITCNQFIHIKAKRYDKDTNYEYINLPIFRKGTMYKNMEVGKEYTLKELGL